jgi:hypothetical protein
MEHRTASGRPYRSGAVSIRHGIVAVHVEPAFDDFRGFTSFRFVWDGREYGRRIDKEMTDRGVATAAGRFAREIAGY